MNVAAPVLNWIDGEWVDSPAHRDSVDPAIGSVIGRYADGGGARAAIDAALRAFRDTPWRRDAALRARVLDELAAAFERHAGALIELLALENGKIKPEAHFEVSMVPSKLRYYARWRGPKRAAAERRGRTSLARAARADGRRRHHRAVEFPVVLMVRSLAPALAAGRPRSSRCRARPRRPMHSCPGSCPKRRRCRAGHQSVQRIGRGRIEDPDRLTRRARHQLHGRPRRGARFPPSVRSGSSVSVSNSAERRRTSSTTPISMRHCPSSKNR